MRDFILTAIPVTIRPLQNSIVLSKEDFFIFFSTIPPANAADIPRKNIARENANCTDCVDLPICSLIGFTNKEKEYTLPIAP